MLVSFVLFLTFSNFRCGDLNAACEGTRQAGPGLGDIHTLLQALVNFCQIPFFTKNNPRGVSGVNTVLYLNWRFNPFWDHLFLDILYHLIKIERFTLFIIFQYQNRHIECFTICILTCCVFQGTEILKKFSSLPADRIHGPDPIQAD